MLVTFISQCEKKALNRSRRILDAFANRIGDNVWQTAITEDGLDTVKKLLRQSATKSTAVSCHRVRTRQRSELVWVVGNRKKFNEMGIVPVNYTHGALDTFRDTHAWQTLSIITYASGIAGLFHDFGKANLLFQCKINPQEDSLSFEPYRHEWVSLRLFEAFVKSKNRVNTTTDKKWLTNLANGYYNFEQVYKDGLENQEQQPFEGLPPFAKLVAWLILSHHKLPAVVSWKQEIKNESPHLNYIGYWQEHLSPAWNSPNYLDPDQASRLQDNWQFQNNLPINSHQWRSRACDIASDAIVEVLPKINDKDILFEDTFSSHIARLALMLADHYVSALSFAETESLLGKYKDNHYSVYANTDWLDDGTKAFKQQLDQHLIGVGYEAMRIVRKLPKLKMDLPTLGDNDTLDNGVKKQLKKLKQLDKNQIDKLYEKFCWQDKAQKLAEEIATDTTNYGFFGINMASTGCGKTLGNAKIIYTLGSNTNGVRFNVALGLRTLTLQTGKEFGDNLGLTKDDLSIAVGGIAVKMLFDKEQISDTHSQSENEFLGSESMDDYLNPSIYLDYTGKVTDHALSKWTKGKSKMDKILIPPVLVCTIDHLIPATEGIKGGQQIAPMLRLLTSDLIIDEPDDFGLDDLPALCRLIHWAGMVGSRVLLSTATMPPALVYACFSAYQSGYQAFAKANIADWQGQIRCAWFDETQTPLTDNCQSPSDFQTLHKKFVSQRVKQLNIQPQKRSGEIIPIQESTDNVYQNMANTIFASIQALHTQHHISYNDKKVSIGLVRMANIQPMIQVAKHLIALDSDNETCIHYCVYHSHFPLAIRSYIEEKLDFILKRNDPNRLISENGLLNWIDDGKHHIFVVLASPVAEVGRDHDYDWAVIEPSSVRSIIQIAGRVLRHRDVYPSQPNIHLLNQNVKGLKGETVCFNRPGFESKHLTLSSHELNHILNTADYETISAIPKIQMPEGFSLEQATSESMVVQEHKALWTKLLANPLKNERQLIATDFWLTNNQWHGQLQVCQPFRNGGKKEHSYHLWIESPYTQPKFYYANPSEKDDNKRYTPSQNIGTQFDILPNDTLSHGNNSYFWFDLSPILVYQALQSYFPNYDLKDISKRFGEVKLSHQGKHKNNEIQQFYYQYQLGVFKDI